MQEEQDTCRICSAPAEPDQPLFYPCKCSGTIRYIHQDCLTTWLAHSRKKTCDVCKHPYSFAKVYDPNMPETLPPLLVIRRFAQQAFFIVIFLVRAVCVGLIWLAFLPWVTMWTWRMYFLMGDSTAWWIANRPRPATLHSLLAPANVTSLTNDTASVLPSNATMYTRVTSHPAWTALSADIFGGQIIASSIIITFVAVFLLREWISQNARPGVFDDADVPPPAEDLLEPPVMEMPEPEPELQPPERVPTPFMEQDDESDSDNNLAKRLTGEPELENPDGIGAEARLRRGQRQARQARHPPHIEQDTLRGRRRALIRNQKRRGLGSDASTGPSPKSPTTALPATFDSTFDVPEGRHRLGLPHRRSSSEPPTVGSSPPFIHEPSPSQPSSYPRTPEDDADAVTTHRASLPRAAPSSSSNIGRSIPERIPNFPRRPPLPVSAVPSPMGSPALGYPPGQLPLASPNLAIYRAPEELGSSLAQPSSPLDGERKDKGKQRANSADAMGDGYFDSSAEAMERERDRYFKLTDDSTPLEVGKLENGSTRAPSRSDTEEEDVEDIAPAVRVHVEHVERLFPGPGDDDDEDDDADDEDEAPELELADGAPFAEPWEGGEPDVERARLVEEVDRMEAELRELQRERADLEQLEAMVDEEGDLDGMLEVIGFRGRMSTVLQNATLVIFALDTAIGLGIWLPFMVGKSTALLSLDPPRLLYVVHSPIRVMRIITDPIVDTGALVFVFAILQPMATLIRSIFNVMAVSALSLIAKMFGDEAESKTHDYAELAYRHVKNASRQSWEKAFMLLQPGLSSNGSNSATPPPTAFLDAFFESDSTLARWAEPRFAELGKQARISSANFQATWIRLALGSDTQEKVFAVALGYGVFTILLALYLNVLTIGTMKTAGRAVRSTVRQQLLVLKVGVFVLIELVAFPLGCGIALDLSTIWLCPGATINSRIAFAIFAPLTSMFYHWLAGTIFMYQFAIVLNGCRRVMRPGALWFIKDPQDQNFHPIRDIIERSSWTQLRKLLLSAEMYVVVISTGAATVGGFLWISPLRPFRWRIREPLSDVPIDLILFILLMPYTMRFLRPSKPMRRWTRRIWRRLSAQLRLSSYMFGKRYHSEEFTPKLWTLSSLFDVHVGMEVQDAEGLHDGGFRRVPATDSIVLGKNMRGAAQVDQFGNPVDERATRLMQAQDNEAARANRDVLKDYTIVYVPPYFTARITLFLTALWIVGSAFAATLVTVPTLLGRGVFNALLAREVHDGYSFLTGFYLLWGAWTVGKSLDRLDKRRQRERDWRGPKAEWSLWVAKRVMRWLANITYMVFTLGFVLPTLVAIVVELYLVLPLRLTLNPNMQVRLRIVDMWMLGILYMKIILRTRRMQAPSQFIRGVERIVRNGWTHPDPLRASIEVIGPAIGGALAMILVPAGLVSLDKWLGFTPMSDKFLLMHVYPGMFAVTGIVSSLFALASSWETWAQSVREKEFLLEMRLQNLEPSAAHTPNSDITPIDGPPLAEAALAAIDRGDAAADSDEEDEEDVD